MRRCAAISDVRPTGEQIVRLARRKRAGGGRRPVSGRLLRRDHGAGRQDRVDPGPARTAIESAQRVVVAAAAPAESKVRGGDVFGGSYGGKKADDSPSVPKCRR